MCTPKVIMADHICRVYKGINRSLAGFQADDYGTRDQAPGTSDYGTIMWDMFMRATTHAQAGRRSPSSAPAPATGRLAVLPAVVVRSG
jgi:hypothetical protein